jgi:hypothetical protein
LNDPATGAPEPLFEYRKELDRLTGREIPQVVLSSVGAVAESAGRQDNANITIGCWGDAGELTAILAVPAFNLGSSNLMGNPGAATLYLGWDGAELEEEAWVRSEQGTRFFSRNPSLFLQKLLSSKNLLISSEPLGQSRTAAAFNLEGLSQYVDMMKGAGCS